MQSFIFDESFYQNVDKVIDGYDKSSEDLVNILLDVQSLVPYHYVPMDVAQYVSRALNVPFSKVYGVISFYSALSDKPRAKHVIQICESTTCMINDHESLKDVLEKELRINVGERTYDDHFGLEYSPCFGACDVAPAIRIGERVYGNLTALKVRSLIEDLRRK